MPLGEGGGALIHGPLSERILDRIYQEKVVLSLGSVLGFILVWYAVTDIFRLMPPIVLPSPEKVFFTIYEKIFVSVGEEKLFGHVGVSLIRIFVGTAIALGLAIPLGILVGWFEDLDAAVTPIFEILRPIPPIAWIPLAILWFGIGLASKVFIIAIGVFFPTLINTYLGVKFTDPLLIKAAQTLGAKDKNILWEVIVPASAAFDRRWRSHRSWIGHDVPGGRRTGGRFFGIGLFDHAGGG